MTHFSVRRLCTLLIGKGGLRVKGLKRGLDWEGIKTYRGIILISRCLKRWLDWEGIKMSQ